MRFRNIPLFLAVAGIGTLAPAQQAASPAQTPPARIVGSVTAINGQSLTIKPDNGAPVTLTVTANARILETQPGAKTLAGATPIQLSGIGVGDRILAAVRPSADGSAMTATTLIAMKEAAVTEHQQAEQADWQRRGVGGLVKTVDAATGTVTIASGARTLTVHTTPKTIVRRYSPTSIKFSDAQSSTLDQIHPGDQLRARGDRSADGADVTADEIVAGTFRNIAGTVVSTDPATNTITVTDLATRKPVTIQVTSDSQMHKLPEQMAQYLAMRLKRTADQGQSPEQSQTQSQGQSHESPAGETASASSDHPAWRQSGGGQHGGDLSQMLQRTPPVQLADLHKGDAVMIVATQGTPGSTTAVTLLAGVEPILTASPSASQSMFSASWNLGGGGGAGIGDEGTP
jgi:ribosomal protein L24